MKGKKIIIKVLFFALIFTTLINCIEIKGINIDRAIAMSEALNEQWELWKVVSSF